MLKSSQFEVADIIPLSGVVSQFTGGQNIPAMQPSNVYLYLAEFKGYNWQDIVIYKINY